MKNYFPAFVMVAALAFVAVTLRAPRNSSDYDVVGFGRLPVLVNGRVKPLDTVARTSLLMLQGRQRVVAPDGRRLTPGEWLLDMLYRPGDADRYQVFEIVHPDVLALLNLPPTEGAGGKRFSALQLAPQLRELDRQAKLAEGTEHAARTPFQRAVIQLRSGILLHQQLQSSLVAPGNEAFLAQLAEVERTIARLASLPAAERANDAHGSEAAKALLQVGSSFMVMDSYSYFHPVPPSPPTPDNTGWKTIGAAWSASIASGEVAPAARSYAALGRAWREREPQSFNTTLGALRGDLARTLPDAMRKTAIESRFNSAQPFYTSTLLYVCAFLIAVCSWLIWPDPLRRAAFGIVILAFTLATVGIATRMWLEARPPVTNLYSSALFVGWGAVGLCLVLEYLYRNAIGSVTAGLIGFASLLIAHHLALGGDTMEMMRAVLDSNFWLATHVVTITVGYSATFLAGFLGAVYVLRGVLTRSLNRETSEAIGRMIYGIVCFATFFSLIGTVLGGIWADQSWGRFWGWDPKENGALLIVIWNAIILHARWGGLAKTRGLCALAIFGNVITAWSWFGVNMLGVGLHSYGFMDSAFWWLVAFVMSQMAIILVAAVPTTKWRSGGLTPRPPTCEPS